jgi:hypothetical protein
VVVAVVWCALSSISTQIVVVWDMSIVLDVID